jgi:isoleucyl-tRNA synthetase
VRDVTTRMDAYDVYGATQVLVAFVESLSNWWLRLSRARFWKSGMDDDKRAAYETLYACLVTLTKVTAPFTPYAAEAMHQNLVVRGGGARGAISPESVHLDAWPEADLAAIDERLSKKIAAVRSLVSLGLQVRTQAKLKVRQPLRTAYVITAHLELLDASSNEQMGDELNVQSTELVPLASAEKYVECRVKPNFRSLGQRNLGREAQALKKTMAALGSAEAQALALRFMGGESVTLDGVELQRADVDVEFVAKEGFAAAGDRVGVVVLDTRIDQPLKDLGLLRELQNRIQAVRKEMGLEYTDRIRVWVDAPGAVARVLGSGEARQALGAEVLAVEVIPGKPVAADGAGTEHRTDVEGESVCLWVSRA